MKYSIISDIWSLGVVFVEILTDYDHVDHVISSNPNKIGGNKGVLEYLEGKFPDLVDFIALIRQMLKKDPEERPTAKMALDHKWFAQYKDEHEENHAESLGSSFDFDFEELGNLKMNQWRALFEIEIMLYHSEEHYARYKYLKKRNPKGILTKDFDPEVLLRMYKYNPHEPLEEEKHDPPQDLGNPQPEETKVEEQNPIPVPEGLYVGAPV